MKHATCILFVGDYLLQYYEFIEWAATTWYRVDLGLEPAPTLENNNIYHVTVAIEIVCNIQL